MTESSAALSVVAKPVGLERPLRYVQTLLQRREFVAVFPVFALLVTVLTVLKTSEVRQQRGDTAIFFQVAENVAHRGAGVSQVFANTQAYLDSNLSTATAADIASDPLAAPQEQERNMLRFHAYYIFYVIAPLLWLFPSNAVLLCLHAVSFLGLLLLAYVTLRRRNIPVLGVTLFCLLVVSHPAWADALLYGQFYPDNLFILAGFVLMCLTSRERTPRAALAAAACVCVLLGERAAITAGIFLIAYAVLYWKRQARYDAYFKAGLGVALFVCGVVLIKVVLANSEYSGFLPASLAVVHADFNNPAFLQKLQLFALVNAPLVVLAFFNVRAAAIAVLMLLPNVFGNIGGAEKVGWASHYHVYYFPSLVWAAMAGYEAIYKKARGSSAWIAVASVSVLILFGNAIDPMSFNPISFGTHNVTNNFFIALTSEAKADASRAGAKALAQSREISQAVPEKAVVSTIETGMPVLYHGRTIRFFPIGIDSADYAVLNFVRQGADVQYSGAINFLGPAELAKVNAQLTSRMKRDGYDFKDAVLIPADGVTGVAVVKRAR